MRGWLVVLAICACRSGGTPLYPAGDDKDEGHGLLARASTQLMTAADDEDRLPDRTRRPYGDSGYGGAAYAGYVVPDWPVSPPNRTPKYNGVQGLTGAVEGTIAVRSTKLATPCGTLEIASVAIVYIEKIEVGRVLLTEPRPASVGGTIVKRGCALAPIAQVVTPLPAALSIHGDAKPARLQIAARHFELQAAGRVAVQLQPGVTRIDADTGAAAWALALETPYYAITDDRGRFRIDELAAGTYELIIWQPPQPKLVNGDVRYGEPAVVKRKVKIHDRRTARVDLR